MTSRKVTETFVEWKCDGCDCEARQPEAAGTGQPEGWSQRSTEIDAGAAPISKGLDLCESCSADPDSAVIRYKESMRRT